MKIRIRINQIDYKNNETGIVEHKDAMTYLEMDIDTAIVKKAAEEGMLDKDGHTIVGMQYEVLYIAKDNSSSAEIVDVEFTEGGKDRSKTVLTCTKGNDTDELAEKGMSSPMRYDAYTLTSRLTREKAETFLQSSDREFEGVILDDMMLFRDAFSSENAFKNACAGLDLSQYKSFALYYVEMD